jgi:hypothetical protein
MLDAVRSVSLRWRLPDRWPMRTRGPEADQRRMRVGRSAGPSQIDIGVQRRVTSRGARRTSSRAHARSSPLRGGGWPATRGSRGRPAREPQRHPEVPGGRPPGHRSRGPARGPGRQVGSSPCANHGPGDVPGASATGDLGLHRRRKDAGLRATRARGCQTFVMRAGPPVVPLHPPNLDRRRHDPGTIGDWTQAGALWPRGMEATA